VAHVAAARSSNTEPRSSLPVPAEVGFEPEAIEHETTRSRGCPFDDFEHLMYRCRDCGSEGYHLDDIAECRPWEVGARAFLPDGTEADG
jgi:hypothetical protein